MKRIILVFSTGLILLALVGFAWAQCPEDTLDSGICDTLYVEGYPPDLLVSPPGPYFVRVPIYVTHDVPNPAIDSIAGFIIPLCYSHTNPTKYCSLTSWWNNTDLYPFPTIDRSIFRHLDGETNWMMDLSEQLMGYEWDFRYLELDGTSHFRFATVPTGSADQKFEEGYRVLLATMTFKLEDTTTITIDSCFWPPASRLCFSRSDAVTYIPRHFLPVCEKVTWNIPPYFTDCVDDQSHHMNGSYSTDDFTAVDNDGMITSVTATPASLPGVTGVTVVYTIPPPAAQVVGYVSYAVVDHCQSGGTVQIIATDNGGAQNFCCCDFYINLFNNAPAITCPDNASFPYDVGYSGQATATDPDGDTLVFEKLDGPAGLIVYADGTITWDTGPGDVGGPYPITVGVTDECGASDECEFLLTVEFTLSNYTFEQQNFLDPDGVVVVPNSDWGYVSFDILPLDDGVVRYLCVTGVIGADTGWIVRNYPVLPSEFIDAGRFGLDFDFNELGISSGTDVSSLEFSCLVTTTIQTSGPGGPYTTVTVYELNHQAFGGDLEEGTPEYTGPGDLVPPYYTVEVEKDSLMKNKGLSLENVPSVQEGHKECASGATARSLKWLSNKHGLGLGTGQSIQEDLDNPEYMDQGVTLRQMVAAKKKYIKDKGLPLEVHYWYSKSYYGPHPEWHNTPGTPSESSDDIDLIEWLWREMKKGQDIEIFIRWDNTNKGHMVTLVGVDKKNKKIEYRDDVPQGDDTKGDDKVKEAELVPLGNGEYGYKNAANRIVSAFAESPKPHKWTYHPRIVNGDLTVYGTINCEIVGDPLFSGYVVVCHEYSGSVPLWANDLIAIFEWDAPCENVDAIKVAAPQLQDGVWRLPPLYDWFTLNLPSGSDLLIPSIGDSTGIIQDVYIVVDLDQWFADPRPPQETYEVIDGECPDLPGYLIGTTPIVFDSLAPPGENPFQTTPLTGTLVWDGELIFAHDTTEGCCQFDDYCDMLTEYDCVVTGGTWYPPPYECIGATCQVLVDTTCHLQHDNGSAALYFDGWYVGDQNAIYYNPVTICPDCGPDVYPFLLTQVEGAFYDYAGVGSVDVIWHFYESVDSCDGPGAEIYSFESTVTTFYPDVATFTVPEVLCLEDDFFLSVEYNSGAVGSIPCILMTDEPSDYCEMFIWYDGYEFWIDYYDFWTTPTGYFMLRADGICNSGACAEILCGDCSPNGVVELGDVVCLISYLYRGGPPPEPLCIGDVNCDGEVQLGDVVYLISYLYRSGPSPCEECCSLKAGPKKPASRKMERDSLQKKLVPQKLPQAPIDLNRLQ